MQNYALSFSTLAIIEAVVFAVFEYKRYQNIKKTGTVRFTTIMLISLMLLSDPCG